MPVSLNKPVRHTAPGRCISGCRESHRATRVFYWRDYSTGAYIPQWRGSAHGQTFVWETFMLLPVGGA